MDNDQNEYPLPNGNDSEVKSSQHLPRFFRTEANNRFLSSTLDNFIKPGVAEKLNGYVGREFAKAYRPDDPYVKEVSQDRQNYQLEPFTIVKDNLNNVVFAADYKDYINQLSNFGSDISDHSLLNRQEFYSWNPCVDWDKLTNYREYYWLPNGPQPVSVTGARFSEAPVWQTGSNYQLNDVIQYDDLVYKCIIGHRSESQFEEEIENWTVLNASTFGVTVVDNGDNYGFVFTPDGVTQNPEIVLYRGVTYTFQVDAPGVPISFRSNRVVAQEWQANVFYRQGELVTNDRIVYTAVVDHRASADFEQDQENWKIDTSFNLTDEVSEQGVEEGTIQVTLTNDTPDFIYYLSDADINTGGLIRVYDIEEASFIDVDRDIIGKETYATGKGFSLTNGQKIYFQGITNPKNYQEGYYYVEGVGQEINLIPESELIVSSSFVDNEVIEFDSESFDTTPFSTSIGSPRNKDYITINRAAINGNLWSKYNRWFHKEVIETASKINKTELNLNENTRAKRPIIEFDPLLKLYNFGTKAKDAVDLVDNFTTDVFSIIEGAEGYNIDGVDLKDKMRILFLNDSDSRVKNKIFTVEFFTFKNKRQIALLETEDSEPLNNETVFVENGVKFKGKVLFYKNNEWQEAQEKIAVNQPPLFDLFDKEGNSLSNEEVYPSIDFIGTKLFSYLINEFSPPDRELGFGITYRSIENSGDIVFSFDLNSDVININSPNYTYLRKYDNLDKFILENGWQKANRLSYQPVITKYNTDGTTKFFPIDTYSLDDVSRILDLTVKVYLDNKLLQENKDYELVLSGEQNVVILTTTPSNNSVLVIKSESSIPKNANGFYEIPSNLEKNPLNEDLSRLTLGEINDHVFSIVSEIPNFSGEYPGISNLRDKGDVSALGRKIIKHSAPLNLPLYHLVDKKHNIIKALDFSRREYAKFKRQFLQLAEELTFDGTVKDHVDYILKEQAKRRSYVKSFYFSDMVPSKGYVKTDYRINDDQQTFFVISSPFTLNELSSRAVLVYLNDVQLTHKQHYTFNNEGFLILTANQKQGDILSVFEYENTNGNIVPATPTKLGLYPLYTPTKYYDDTYLEGRVILQGHDGSITFSFEDYRDDLLLDLEKRIHNNIKIEYNTTEFSIRDIIPSLGRETGITQDNLDKAIYPDFSQWLSLVNADPNRNLNFDRESSFTFNYTNSVSKENFNLRGYWRKIYKEVFETDRPHTHPWEMLGFAKQPTWWEEQYGPAPYTRNNLLLWEDLEQGIIREPNKAPVVDKKSLRPRLTSFIPVDSQGGLLSPLECGLIKNYNSAQIDRDFLYGDWSPVETAWKKSSEYPFSILKACVLSQPALVFSTAFDCSRQIKDKTNKIIYADLDTQLSLSGIKFPTGNDDTVQTFTSGLINYIRDYVVDSNENYNLYKNNLVNIDNQIGFGLAGFSTKDNINLILDSRTPLANSSVFLPKENFNFYLKQNIPAEIINYSAVIIEKSPEGFIIRGYDSNRSTFFFNEAIQSNSDRLINVGGVPEPTLEWAPSKTYNAGSIVLNSGQFYRTTQTHVSQQSFDNSKFVRIPNVPFTGGRDAILRNTFGKTVSLRYGAVLDTVQDVVDFLLGYGNWLESKGFKFDYYDSESGLVTDWVTSAKEFLFWTTQNWAKGAILSLSPAAFKMRFVSEYYTVNDIHDTFYNYSLKDQLGNKIQPENVSATREKSGEFQIRSLDPNIGIYSIQLQLAQKEHAILLDDKTVFGDVVYDKEQGYRQERIKLLGYRTANWDGSINADGFIIDDFKITDWQPWRDYFVGEVVRYKEFFYAADSKVKGSEFFDANKWSILSKKPESAVLPNWDYRINQFADFYDLDSDNFDAEQQKFAQHLIGYQNRQYLQNIINDEVSQYKFYQGYIADKGTLNAIDKLFDVLSSADEESIDLKEEWAVRNGMYGSLTGFEEVEYTLDEEKFRTDPQPIHLVNEVDTTNTDLEIKILPREVEIKPIGYNHYPLPEKIVTDDYTKTSGFVYPKDVDVIVDTLDDVLKLDSTELSYNYKIWTGRNNRDWDVFTYLKADLTVDSFEKDQNLYVIHTKENTVNIRAGDIIGLIGDNSVEGLYKVEDTSEKSLTVSTDIDKTPNENLETTIIAIFVSSRFKNTEQFQKQIETIDAGIDRIWVDNLKDNNWAVLESSAKFKNLDEVTLQDTDVDGFGSSIDVDKNNSFVVVGSPYAGDGKVYVYSRTTNSSEMVQVDLLEPDRNFAKTYDYWQDNKSYLKGDIVYYSGLYYQSINAHTSTESFDHSEWERTNPDDVQNFGTSVAISNDAEYIAVGAPNASEIVSRYQEAYDPTKNYNTFDIVKYQDKFWQAEIDILGSVGNIEFDSFQSVAQNYIDIGIIDRFDKPIYTLLTGKYPIKKPEVGNFSLQTDHIIVKAPTQMFQGSDIGDTVSLKWNSVSYAHQAYDALEIVQPFDGDILEIDEEFFSSRNFIIAEKIETIIYVQDSTVIPNVGQKIETDVSTGEVAEVHQGFDTEISIYVKNINGKFPRSGSLTTSIGEFVGEYEIVAPDDFYDTDDYWGGYWKFILDFNYEVNQKIQDEGKGLVYTDVRTQEDPLPHGYFYNVLDTLTDYEFTNPSEISVLTYQGLDIEGNTQIFPSNKFLLRAPSDLTGDIGTIDTGRLNVVSPGSNQNSEIEVFFNTLRIYSDRNWMPNTQFFTGEILFYEVKGITQKYWRVLANHRSRDQFLTDNQQIDSLRYQPLDSLPGKDPNDINLSAAELNSTHKVFDLWDGYLDVTLTRVDNVREDFELVEPEVGLIVETVNQPNVARGEIVYYQKLDSTTIRIYLKSVTGVWLSPQELGGFPIDIQFIADETNSIEFYRSTRVFGEIIDKDFGNAESNVGRYIVIESSSLIPLPETSSIVNSEYWIYQQGTVQGIPREPNIPARNNSSWSRVYRLSASENGSNVGPTKEGLIYIYERQATFDYRLISTILAPNRVQNSRFGSEISLTNINNLVKLFALSKEGFLGVTPDRIYTIVNGEDSGQTYFWDLAIDKNYQGVFSQNENYVIGDIVFYNNKLYVANTFASGTFNVNEWSESTVRPYLGYFPNDTDSVLTPSANDIDDSNLIINRFSVSENGEVIAVVSDATSDVKVYRSLNGLYKPYQSIEGNDASDNFAYAISISEDGKNLAIADPDFDKEQQDQGIVYVYRQKDREFVLYQSITSPFSKQAEGFGFDLSYSRDYLAVSSRNGNALVEAYFDDSDTIFDKGFVKFEDLNENAGCAFIFESQGNYLIYSDRIDYDNSLVKYFGTNVKLQDNIVYVGLPNLSDSAASVVSLRRDPAKTLWKVLRKTKPTVDIKKIKQVFLYDNDKKQNIQQLDFIDVLQGKIPGVADQEIKYKTFYDPASYTDTTQWGEKQVGEIWWDLNNATFLNPYQATPTYSANNWNRLFSDLSSVDIYEWVESTVKPSRWDSISDSEEGNSRGITGQSKYSDRLYIEKQTYNDISKKFETKYYFWVKNKETIPNSFQRNASAQDISKLIENPFSQGYRFIALISPDQFALYNCNSLIKDKNISLVFQYWVIDNQEINLHREYQIITDGLATSRPSYDIELKWFDSLVGYDSRRRQVPDASLPEKQKYGTLNFPRQSWFVNRVEALKQVIERINRICKEKLITESKDITRLTDADPAPSETLGLYDVSVDFESDLQFIGVSKIQQAQLEPEIVNGKIVNITVANSGRGYRISPKIEILGTGTNAELNAVLDNTGRIVDVEIVKAGENYSNNTNLVVRPFSALVLADSDLDGRWAIYSKSNSSAEWTRVQSQGFDVNRFWSYMDWYEKGYSSLTDIDFIINQAYELDQIDSEIGDVVKIENIGSSGWLLLEKVNDLENVDYVENYKTVGRKNGTIEFLPSLYDADLNLSAYDQGTYDKFRFDGIPSVEIRIILETIRDHIFINDLSIEYNQLILSSIRYVLAEQQAVDWVFKTSFVKARHNAGELKQKITFENDSLESYQQYIEEVKPYKTEVREYVSSYNTLDRSFTSNTDFDFPPRFVEANSKIEPFTPVVTTSGEIDLQLGREIGYPNKHWLDKAKMEVISVEVVDQGSGYKQKPTIEIIGDGFGAKAKAYLGKNGSLNNVEVTNSGSGFVTQPEVRIIGALEEDGKPARAVARIGNSPVRSLTTLIKFDRITLANSFDTLQTIEVFVGSGNQREFDLEWPMDLRANTVNISIDNLEIVSGQFSYSNVNVSNRAFKQVGKIFFENAPAENSRIEIRYNKNLDILNAIDRIKLFYNSQIGNLGNSADQLMNGADYEGVEISGFGFQGVSGWDSQPWFTQGWDVFSTTFEDEIIRKLSVLIEFPSEVKINEYNVKAFDEIYQDSTNATGRILQINGNTILVETDINRNDINFNTTDHVRFFGEDSSESYIILEDSSHAIPENVQYLIQTTKPLEQDVQYNVYVIERDSNGILISNTRVDDSDFDTEDQSNSNAVTQPIVGDGSTSSLLVEDIGLDKISLTQESIYNVIIRKETSDGSETPDPDSYDLDINGSLFDFETARGLKAEDIVIDGDQFVSPTNSGGLEESVPGQILDAVDIKVVEKSNEGSSNIEVRNYMSDGVSTIYSIGLAPVKEENIIVKINNVIQKQYIINYNTNSIEFLSAPEQGKQISIVNIGNAGSEIIGFDKFIADVSSAEYELDIKYEDTVDYFVSVNGKAKSIKLAESKNKNFIIKFAEKIDKGARINVIISRDIESVPQISQVTVDNFIADESTTAFELDSILFLEQPAMDKTIVLVNDKVLNSGFNQYFTVTDERNYAIQTNLEEINILSPSEVEVYLNNKKLEYLLEWSFIGFKILEDSTVIENTVLLDEAIGKPGDRLEIYVISSGDYRFGYFENDTFISTRGEDSSLPTIYIDAELETGDNVTVYSFSNHDSQRIERQRFFVDLTEDLFDVEQRQVLKGNFALNTQAESAEQIWFVYNNKLLDSSVDYYLSEDRSKIILAFDPEQASQIEIIHFSAPTLANEVSWRQFKDLLGQTHYKIIKSSTKLSAPLHWYDGKIEVENGDILPQPAFNSSTPAVIFVNGERIEYFVREGNILKQLRRGTLGTGVKDLYKTNTEVVEQGAINNIPYKDSIFVNTVTGNGVDKEFTPTFGVQNTNEVEVYVAGTMLRKSNLVVNSYVYNQGSPEEEIELGPEFSVVNNRIILDKPPSEGVSVSIVKKSLSLWNDTGETLRQSLSTEPAAFLNTQRK